MTNHVQLPLRHRSSSPQTILVGDSGVGKTSLLVQFDQGKFQTGSFSATVGIGFTVGQSRCLFAVFIGKGAHRRYSLRSEASRPRLVV
ncbi:hypothetical protein HPB48_025791 [Haemaphysalis longicornis]|uniref:Ras-related protein Rab-26 n=1 Tax=Haemaphysalis longicornis TaxID=44386 RepID=A0A9J6H889_HAELO|nr:hypothetical protein HPB48_025791 [Haemaphysalis longicornis]